MNSSREKQRVRETDALYDINTYRTIDEWISFFNKFKDDGWEYLKFDTDYDTLYISLELHKERLETDKEYQKRMEQLDKIEKQRKEDIKKRMDKKESEQRVFYEKLKKKFEK